MNDMKKVDSLQDSLVVAVNTPYETYMQLDDHASDVSDPALGLPLSPFPSGPSSPFVCLCVCQCGFSFPPSRLPSPSFFLMLFV